MGAIHPRDLGTILSIWAHPDDETYLAGGVMAAASANGQRVVCVTATDGERGTDDPVRWPPDRLGPVRRWEAAAAMAVLGVTDHRHLGLPDGRLAESEGEGRAAVEALIAEVAPDTLLTFGPDGRTFHPDHVAVHRWVADAWAAGGRRARLLCAAATTDALERFLAVEDDLGVYMTDERPVGVPPVEAALHVRLEGPALDQKLTALRSMATQTGGLIAAVGARTFAELVAEEAFVVAPRPGEPLLGAAATPALA